MKRPLRSGMRHRADSVRWLTRLPLTPLANARWRRARSMASKLDRGSCTASSLVLLTAEIFTAIGRARTQGPSTETRTAPAGRWRPSALWMTPRGGGGLLANSVPSQVWGLTVRSAG